MSCDDQLTTVHFEGDRKKMPESSSSQGNIAAENHDKLYDGENARMVVSFQLRAIFLLEKSPIGADTRDQSFDGISI